MQLNELWSFMQVDMEASNFENAMRQSDNRQKLLKQRNLLLELQNSMAKIESDVSVMMDRIEAVKDEYARLEANLAALVEAFNEHKPETAEEVDKQVQNVKKLTEALTRYERELTKLRRDAETRDKDQKAIRTRAARTKQEFDALKLEYDKEFKLDTQKLNALKEKAAAASAGIEPGLLSKYREIKQHCNPPMSKLIENQCSGCFMDLPKATLRRVKSGDELVVCDNCGRILYSEE